MSILALQWRHDSLEFDLNPIEPAPRGIGAVGYLCHPLAGLRHYNERLEIFESGAGLAGLSSAALHIARQFLMTELLLLAIWHLNRSRNIALARIHELRDHATLLASAGTYPRAIQGDRASASPRLGLPRGGPVNQPLIQGRLDALPSYRGGHPPTRLLPRDRREYRDDSARASATGSNGARVNQRQRPALTFARLSPGLGSQNGSTLS